MLTNEQINLVKRAFERVAPRADAFTGDFYDALFGLQPSLRLLFPDDLTLQKKKLVEMLAAIVAVLDEPQKFVPALEESGCRHALYGVRDHHYAPVGAALLKALESTLGAAYDAETAGAWSLVYGMMSETMMRGARRLKETDGDAVSGLKH